MIGWGHVSFEWLGGPKWTFGRHIANQLPTGISAAPTQCSVGYTAERKIFQVDILPTNYPLGFLVAV